MKTTVRALCLIAALGLFHCSGKDSRKSGASSKPSASGVAGHPVLSVLGPPKVDSSLELQAYLDAGMPSPDKVWGLAEYTKAAEVLSHLKADQYPRENTARSGEVFARFVAKENLSRIQDTSRPLGERVPEALDLFDGIKKLTKLYVEAVIAHGPVDSESIAALDFQMLDAAATLDVMEAFSKTLDPTDAKYETRMKGMSQMLTGMAEMCRGSVMVLTEHHEDGALQRYTTGLRSSLPKLVSRLPPKKRAAVIEQLKAAGAKVTPAIAKETAELLTATEGETPVPLGKDDP